jgi:type VI secretion system protein VasI
VDAKTSDFQDTMDVFMSVMSEDPVSCGFLGSKKIRLYARCVENTTALIISTHCHVASGFSGYGTVEYRIDDNPASKRGFDESTNNRSLGLWNGGSSIPFLKSLFGAQELLVRFTPFNESPVTAKFNISGLEDAIAPLRESCHW